MKITIIGGGNIGMCLAGEISRVKGYDVTIYASNAEEFDRRIQVVDDEKGITYLSGDIYATDSLKDAVEFADMIICTYPSQLRRKFVDDIKAYIKNDAYLGFFPGYGGAELYCEDLINRGVTIFALQKVPYVARTKVRGKIAGLWSKKSVIKIAAIPKNMTDNLATILEDMLLIRCERLRNYMAATLLPGNPLLHTSGSYVYLKNYVNGQIFPSQIFYYQSWNDECSRLICSFSDEMMEICDSLKIDLSEVDSIQKYYESPSPEDLTRKFHSIPSFHDLVLPMKQIDNGFLPDFSSRFYTEDIPYGVCTLKALGLIAKVQTPTIDTILEWYYRMTGKKYFNSDGSFGADIDETAIPQLFGLDTDEKLFEFYTR
ncbi:MAG: NAD/NADP octopine/nopaline dehydrogenase family protein [Clostridia bacterium]|nr:NAD/NADP octopine/nopaline dehydrogenase family protein [Clostridia bacterium]